MNASRQELLQGVCRRRDGGGTAAASGGRKARRWMQGVSDAELPIQR